MVKEVERHIKLNRLLSLSLSLNGDICSVSFRIITDNITERLITRSDDLNETLFFYILCKMVLIKHKMPVNLIELIMVDYAGFQCLKLFTRIFKKGVRVLSGVDQYDDDRDL
jgi:hypothetical protein